MSEDGRSQRHLDLAAALNQGYDRALLRSGEEKGRKVGKRRGRKGRGRRGREGEGGGGEGKKEEGQE